jgi:phage terminase large subunit-like protein
LPSLESLEAEATRRARNKITRYYPDTGPLRRELYPKHLAFFAAGGKHQPTLDCPADCTGAPHAERAFIAGNRTGKTEAGAFEMTLHLTGRYPHWWQGLRFDKPIRAWAAGDTSKTVREIIQEKLLGPVGEQGTGMIPGDLIAKVTTKQGIAEAVDTIYVRHIGGKTSSVTLKTYQEGRESFQGAGLDFCWLDEAVDEAIYDECLMRLMVTEGSVILTFTPLQGLTPLVLRYLPGGKPAEKPAGA